MEKKKLLLLLQTDNTLQSAYPFSKAITESGSKHSLDFENINTAVWSFNRNKYPSCEQQYGPSTDLTDSDSNGLAAQLLQY